MLSAYERHHMISYVTNALRYLERRRRDPMELAEWLEINAYLLGGDGLEIDPHRTAIEADIVAAAHGIAHDNGIPRQHRSRATTTRTRPKLRRKLRKVLEKEQMAKKQSRPTRLLGTCNSSAKPQVCHRRISRFCKPCSTTRRNPRLGA